MLRALAIAALVVILIALALVAAGQAGLLAGKRPADLGVRGGHLKPPPHTPNGVSSQAQPGDRQVAPLAYRGEGAAAFAALKRVIEAMPGAQLVRSDANYLYAEFSSRWLGFVDDTEFYLDDAAKVIHVRSAARLGRSDLGVNRARVEAIRGRLAAALPAG